MQLLFSNWVIPLRLERKTYCLEGSCSIQLSYGTDLVLSQKRCKDSANRMKFQIYLRISEVQPIFRLQSRLKLCKNRAKKQISTREIKKKYNFSLLSADANVPSRRSE